jgi:hypothetical protein
MEVIKTMLQTASQAALRHRTELQAELPLQHDSQAEAPRHRHALLLRSLAVSQAELLPQPGNHHPAIFLLPCLSQVHPGQDQMLPRNNPGQIQWVHHNHAPAAAVRAEAVAAIAGEAAAEAVAATVAAAAAEAGEATAEAVAAEAEAAAAEVAAAVDGDNIKNT